MKRFIIFFLVICFSSLASFSQNILGKWKTIDDETGKAKSIVKIYKKDDNYYGDIVELINPENPNALCETCTGKDKNKPLLGLTIIKDMKLKDDAYEDGTIFNPTNGKTYKCRLKFEDDPNTLQVRGYVAFFYKTQYWKRVE